jgi:hypothetical protein
VNLLAARALDDADLRRATELRAAAAASPERLAALQRRRSKQRQ